MRNSREKNSPNLQNRRRILSFLMFFFLITLILIGRLGYIQLIKGNEYKKGAYEQWSRDVVINAKRGVIYDSKGKKLAISISSNKVVCHPADVKKGSSDRDIVEEKEEEDENFILKFFKSINKKYSQEKEEELLQASLKDLKSLDEIAGILAEILEMDKKTVYDKITENSNYVVLKRWITDEQAQKIVDAKLTGIRIVEDNKRVYPYGNFAPYVIGFTDVDQKGLYGVEATFDKYLTGIPGRLVVNTDAYGRELPYGYNEYFEAQEGYGIVLTIDETIQHFAEKAVEEALANTNAKRVNLIMMEPKTGDILAMVSKPDYDPNNPREPIDEKTKAEWSNLTQQELQNKWYDMWRSPIVNDIYEPGSTFKPLVVAIALQENKASVNKTYYCDGYVRQVKSYKPIKCWRYYNPHGQQTLSQVLENSCNDGMAEIGLELGAETFYKYLRALGFGEKSGVALNGEGTGIVNHYKYMQDVNVATQSFGQGVSVTALQMVTALSSLANGGDLMEPRIVKQLIDKDGNIIKNFDSVTRRTVFSKEVANTLMEMLGNVVTYGGAKAAAVPGYKVGGKTGTAQKVVDGQYPEGVYISSFVGVAPIDDPKFVCLMTIDEPQGQYYASVIAAPVVGTLIEETLKYMEVEPQYTPEELGAIEKATIEVPNLKGLTVVEASKVLEKLGLQSSMIIDVEEDAIVIDQFPVAGEKVKKKSVVTLYLQ